MPNHDGRGGGRRVQTVRPRRVTAHALLAGHRSVLIVEDNAWLSSVMADALVGEAYKVLQTASPRVADRLAREYRPNAIVLDLELPAAAGPDLLKRLKASPRTGPIPVVALSSQPERTSPEIRQATRAVMSKPLGLPQLLEQLSEAAPFPAGSDTAA